MSTISSDELRAILAGCEGVTPGPWDVDEGNAERPPVIVSRDIDADDSGRAVHYKTEIATIADTMDDEANAAHIARLDPQTVASMCRELLSLRESHPIEDGAGWIEWNGSPGRVPRNLTDQTPVEVKTSDGRFYPAQPASNMPWGIAGHIIAYRVIPSNPGTSKVEPKTLTGKAATDAIFDPKFDNVVD